jgi:hypothetical protein
MFENVSRILEFKTNMKIKYIEFNNEMEIRIERW